MRALAHLLAIVCVARLPGVLGAPLRAPGALEDPSDALWLRWYNGGNEFLALFFAGGAALGFMLLAMAADGAWIDPRRTRIAASALGLLASCAAAALLLLVAVPRRWQPALAGSGPLQSALCVLAVVLTAAALPGAALAVQAAAACMAEWTLLCVQVAWWAVVGLTQFAGALFVFHARSLALQTSALYGAAGDDVDIYSWQLVFSSDFLRAVGRNGLLVNVPGAVNRMCRVVLRSAMAPHLYERIVGHGTLSAGEAREDSGQSTPLRFEEDSPGGGRRAMPRRGVGSGDELTPLLSPVEDSISLDSGRLGSHLFGPET